MDKLYTAREVASLFKVCLITVHNWDKKGILKSQRTPTNRRYYTESQISKFLKVQSSQ